MVNKQLNEVKVDKEDLELNQEALFKELDWYTDPKVAKDKLTPDNFEKTVIKLAKTQYNTQHQVSYTELGKAINYIMQSSDSSLMNADGQKAISVLLCACAIATTVRKSESRSYLDDVLRFYFTHLEEQAIIDYSQTGDSALPPLKYGDNDNSHLFFKAGFGSSIPDLEAEKLGVTFEYKLIKSDSINKDDQSNFELNGADTQRVVVPKFDKIPKYEVKFRERQYLSSTTSFHGADIALICSDLTGNTMKVLIKPLATFGGKTQGQEISKNDLIIYKEKEFVGYFKDLLNLDALKDQKEWQNLFKVIDIPVSHKRFDASILLDKLNDKKTLLTDNTILKSLVSSNNLKK